MFYIMECNAGCNFSQPIYGLKRPSLAVFYLIDYLLQTEGLSGGRRGFYANRHTCVAVMTKIGISTLNAIIQNEKLEKRKKNPET